MEPPFTRPRNQPWVSLPSAESISETPSIQRSGPKGASKLEMEEEEIGFEEGRVSAFDIEEINPTFQGSSVTHAPSSTPTRTRTKRARIETLEVLKKFTSKISKISDAMEAASEHIGRLANYFQHESDSTNRRLQVTQEVMKIAGLTPTQVLQVSKKIALNPLEVDFFFSLTNDYKYAYAQSLLLLDQ